MERIKLFFALLFQWKYKTNDSELRKGQIIITHEFGDQRTLSAATRQIVNVGTTLSKQLRVPLICQFPGDQQAFRNGVRPLLIITKNLSPNGIYLDTAEVNRQLFKECEKNDWKYVIVCTHPDHVWRAAKNIKKFGLIPLVPDLSSIYYDSHCSRFSLAYRWAFLPRELATRLLYFLKGYLSY